MTDQPSRKPYDHALHLINHTGESISIVTTGADGRPRELDGRTTAGVLAALSNLAVASALLAVADAVRGEK
ncbi:hypothetical protein [Streptomyces cyslabdanicus]|uniref:hypothetical protein n=1 Tax=Streptomyces cyslabdanicus TaxID=1470456 RepID=UPI0040445AC1